MALPTVRLETTTPSGSSVTFANGTYTITAGRITVDFRDVREALQKNWTISDPNVKFPPSRTSMCPPSALTVVYAAVPQPYTAAARPPATINSGAILTFADLPQGAPAFTPAGFGQSPYNSAPAYCTAEVLAGMAWRPAADKTPYAAISLPDGTTLMAPYPGNGMIEIPAQHVEYYKTQGWTLLSDYL